jgi:hypothetical protein
MDTLREGAVRRFLGVLSLASLAAAAIELSAAFLIGNPRWLARLRGTPRRGPRLPALPW